MSNPVIRDLARQRILVVDDDELTRELLLLVAVEAGLAAVPFASGEAVLAHLACAPKSPDGILCDMQMPGIAGTDLARRLRALCGPETILLAMSGSNPGVTTSSADEDSMTDFDAFLLKPFSARQLAAAWERRVASTTEPVSPGAPVLDTHVYAELSRSMPPARLAELYQLCIVDARKRVATMEAAAAAFDDHAYRAAAHSIKGGCAMVGAVEAAAMASGLEVTGIPPSRDQTPLNRLLLALSRLERMLNDKASKSQAGPSMTGPEGHQQR